MKPPEIESRLWDIRSACEKILRVTRDKTVEEYSADDLLPDVVVRQLTIVGEATARIAEREKVTAERLGEYPRIIALRNQLVHNYPHVDQNAVWIIVQRDVPALLERVDALLASLGHPMRRS